MRSIIFLLFILSAAPTWAGLYLKCQDSASVSWFLDEVGGLECSDKKGNKFHVEIRGYGIGLSFSEGTASIQCPLVSKKRILAGKALDIVGPRINLGVKVGFDLALGVNHRGAVCAFEGFSLFHYGVGAAIDLFRVSSSAHQKGINGPNAVVKFPNFQR